MRGLRYELPLINWDPTLWTTNRIESWPEESITLWLWSNYARREKKIIRWGERRQSVNYLSGHDI
jgi:hypothetical protein